MQNAAMIADRQALLKMGEELDYLQYELMRRFDSAKNMVDSIYTAGWQDDVFKNYKARFDEISSVLVPVSKKMHQFAELQRKEAKVLQDYAQLVETLKSSINNTYGYQIASVSDIKAKVNIHSAELAEQSLRNISKTLESDFRELTEEVKILSQKQEDQNYDKFLQLIGPGSSQINDIATNMRNMAAYAEQVRAMIVQYVESIKT